MSLKTIQDVSVSTLANLVGRSANVALPLTVIAVFGADAHTDLFFLIMALGFFCFGTLANALTESTVPLLVSTNLRIPPSSILTFAGTVMLIGLALGCLWFGFIERFNPVYIPALALMMGAGIANGVLSGVLHVQERYAPSGVTWALRFVPLLALLTIRPSIDALPWLALAIGAMDWLRCAILIHCSRRGSLSNNAVNLGYFISRFRTTYGTVLLAMVIMGFNPLADRFIAQLSGPGGLSILDTAERVYAMLGVLCTIGLMTVLLTRFSQKASIGRLDHGWRRTLSLVAVWSLAWMIVGTAVGHWGLDWWLSRMAALDARQGADVTQAYWYYLIGLPVFIAGVVYTRRIQALHRTSILVWAAGLSVVLNLIAGLVLRSVLGIPGIALAKIPVHTATALLLIRAAHRKSE